MIPKFSSFLRNTTFPFSSAVFAYVFVGLVALGAFQTFRLARVQRELVASSLVRDSLAVAADSTRRVQVAGLDTAIVLWQRRAYQTEQSADFLDKKLKQESKTRQELELTIKQMVAQTSAPVTEDTTGLRKADFHLYQAPFTVGVNVELPRPPATGVARVSVTTDTAHVGVRVTCGKPVDGIKPASVAVTTPTWLGVKVDSASQDVGVCNDQKPSFFSRATQLVEKIGLLAGGVWLGHLLP